MTKFENIIDQNRSFVWVFTISLCLILILTLFSNAIGLGIVSTSFIKVIGKTLSLCIVALALDLVWGYCGILSLGHFAFFALGGYMIGMWLMYERTKDIVINSISSEMIPLSDVEIKEAIGTQIFGVVGGAEIPWVWFFADSFFIQITLVVLVPGILAFVFGWLAFRSRVTGVYLSILTQALTLALSLYLLQNDNGFRGNNGLSGLQNIPNFEDLSQDFISLYFLWGSFIIFIFSYLICLSVTKSKLGKIIMGIRDNEPRVRFLGYNVETYKLFIFVLTAILSAVAGAFYYPQAGIINPTELAPIASIYVAVWVSIGGRGRLYGAVLGAASVSLISSYFTSGQLGDINLGIFTITWVDWWLVILGIGFILITLYASNGISSVFDTFRKNKKNE